MNRIRPVNRAFDLLREFFRLQAAGGTVLIFAAAAALALANSPWHGLYEGFRHARIGSGTVEWWINDALMAVFFLLVALEIKREAISGQLSSFSRLLLPVLCAIGGVAVPALVFSAINRADAVAMRGWAVPTATDIAFALGVLALLGSRVPLGMKLLLSTIAVVDDLVAILIIAIFYTHDLSPAWLGAAAACVAAMWLLNRLRVANLAAYLILGAATWYCVLQSGVHATLAGVVTGLMIPLGREAASTDQLDSPLERLEHALHPWVAFAILPLFAFANAGLSLQGLRFDDLLASMPLGVALGLLLGKPVGIVGTALLARALGWARLPEGMGNAALVGLGLLCGIGFTMSLFIADLAYGRVEGHFKDSAVLGVLCGSAVSAALGWLWLRLALKPDAANA
ncbi:MAG: Na+/H+ antiporter NhaA [Pseudoxanthomonas sp.]